jgi:RNA polymerase sigma-70 factor (ECF subfamily)
MLRAAVMHLGVFGRRPRVENAEEPHDLGLARRVARGEVAALGELYDAHHEAVRAFAQRLFADAAEAEDLTQEVFLSAPSALKRFEGRAALRTFLLSIAVNHARHQKRAVARRLHAMEKLHQEPKQAGESPEQAQERQALAARMQRLLEALPIDQRVAVVLSVIEERTSKEAAEIVGVPEATIRTRVFHALRKMREMRDEKEGA